MIQQLSALNLRRFASPPPGSLIGLALRLRFDLKRTGQELPAISPKTNNVSRRAGILATEELTMKKLYSIVALAILSTSLMGGLAIAQDHHDNHNYVQHKDWKKGAVIQHDDWDRGDKVDYQQYHLSAPPNGYEWRMIDGNYVLVNVSNFHIRTVIRVH
jgi:Ni/Co efflux regulator RcnB